jgi:hypothetical protein
MLFTFYYLVLLLLLFIVHVSIVRLLRYGEFVEGITYHVMYAW